ncbi:MAG: sigma-70 family RNA polymerase sigma factor [Planctomycetaceae bacterium]|nr:sigma-70 family RNA polymerase sigma factor [Planctomycetaceae bacterium]
MDRRSPTDTIDWAAAWKTHAGWLRTVVLSRLGEPQAADDVLQQVGLAVAHEHVRPTDPARVGPWLYRVAVRQCLMFRRAAGRRRKLLQKVQGEATDANSECDESPLDWLLHAERREIARKALDELPDVDRQILLLKHTEHWTYQQLASHLGVTVHTVEYRLLRAREELRKRIARLGFLEAMS